MKGVQEDSLATQIANHVTAVVKEAQMKILVLDPVLARRMLKEETVVAANSASLTCKRIILKGVMSVSVQEFRIYARVPTGPMTIYKI